MIPIHDSRNWIQFSWIQFERKRRKRWSCISQGKEPQALTTDTLDKLNVVSISTSWNINLTTITWKQTLNSLLRMQVLNAPITYLRWSLPMAISAISTSVNGRKAGFRSIMEPLSICSLDCHRLNQQLIDGRWTNGSFPYIQQWSSFYSSWGEKDARSLASLMNHLTLIFNVWNDISFGYLTYGRTEVTTCPYLFPFPINFI